MLRSEAGLGQMQPRRKFRPLAAGRNRNLEATADLAQTASADSKFLSERAIAGCDQIFSYSSCRVNPTTCRCIGRLPLDKMWLGRKLLSDRDLHSSSILSLRVDSEHDRYRLKHIDDMTGPPTKRWTFRRPVFSERQQEGKAMSGAKHCKLDG
jgi:hypothetical protein